MKRKTILDIKKLKRETPIVCLTAYSCQMAKLLDNNVDIILVGDSLGMVLYGMDSTLPVTLDMMINHGKAVVKASSQALVVVDMPFGTYQESKEQAFKNAATLIAETGCGAVKLEGGVHMAETIEFLTQRGIAVMAHIGLQPQSVNADGGYHFHGRNGDECKRIFEDAIAVEKAGAFAVVLEGITISLASDITAQLKIPTIGIGASPICDGQVLVTDDLLGMFGNDVPKFVRRYADLNQQISNAIEDFSKDVRGGEFPSADECYELKDVGSTKRNVK